MTCWKGATPGRPSSAMSSSTRVHLSATRATSAAGIAGFAVIGKSRAWLLPRVPGPRPRRIAISRSPAAHAWKIFDNLRRSLVAHGPPPAPADHGFVAAEPALVLDTRSFSSLLAVAPTARGPRGALRKPADLTFGLHLRAAIIRSAATGPGGSDAGLPAVRCLFESGCHRPHDLANVPDAHATCWNGDFERFRTSLRRARLTRHRPRTCPSRRQLPRLAIGPGFTRAEPRSRKRCPGSSVDGLAASGLVDQSDAARARGIRSQPAIGFPEDLAPRPGGSSRRSSAKTISWLPPDNFQELPVPSSRIARRRPTWGSLSWPIWQHTTSALSRPTDLSSERPARSRPSTARAIPGPFLQLVRYRDSRPLPPSYVSTVDSGNLAGHLLTLVQGWESGQRKGFLPSRSITGLRARSASLRALFHQE